MPGKKKHTEFRTGAEGIIPPVVEMFLKTRALPKSWGHDERQRRKSAYFMADVASKPTVMDELHNEVSFAVFANDMRRHHFCELFMQEPDFALELMIFVRKKMKIGWGNKSAALRTAIGFLREGAVTRFNEVNQRDPTDGELSAMIKEEKNQEIPPDMFGEARRKAHDEDEEIDKIHDRLQGDDV